MLPSDQEKALIERLRAGDAAAFEPLITPYRQPLLGLAYRLTRNMEDAKEVTQETFLRAFKYIARFDTERSFKNWITTILVHAARHHHNRKTRDDRLLSAEPLRERALDTSGGPAVDQENRELRARLMECVDVLTPREREIFLLRDVEGLNIQETVRIAGGSAVSVRVHLSAARRKIRDRIKLRYPEILGRSS
jgi:RNA polymerase sigma-70 factor (ECF subfamily)